MNYILQKDIETNELIAVNKIDSNKTISIPLDPANTDYQKYLEWVAEGNEPEAAD
jgi:Tfp pilus assembly PilM family ATPase